MLYSQAASVHYMNGNDKEKLRRNSLFMMDLPMPTETCIWAIYSIRYYKI